MFSIKTRSLRNRGFLLDFGIVNCNSIPCLNVNVNFSGWYELGIVTREKFLDWVHICVEVDMVNATLRAAVNGDVLKTVHNVPGLNPPHSKLNMRLGVVQDSFDRAPTQYIGSVSNVKIFNLGQRTSKYVYVRILNGKLNKVKRKSREFFM